jgi:hypothetical protein
MNEEYLAEFYEERFWSEGMPPYSLLTCEQRGILASTSACIIFVSMKEIEETIRSYTKKYKPAVPKDSDTRSLNNLQEWPMIYCEECGERDMDNWREGSQEGFIYYSGCNRCDFLKETLRTK